jgi:hypothetical protein
MSYQASALNYSKQDIWQNELELSHEDARKYTGCPYLMGGMGYNCFYLWYREKVKFHYRKAFYFGYSNAEKKRLPKLHQQYLMHSISSKGNGWVFLGGMAQSMLMFGLPALLVTLFLLDFFAGGVYRVTNSFLHIIIIPGSIISFITFNICNQIYKRVADEEGGYVFERTTGKIYWHDTDKQAIEMDFKDCVPYIVGGHTPMGTGNTHDGYLYNTKLKSSIPIATSSYRYSVLTWNFLLNYMDTSQPLPDIPLFASVRHLDPTTKAYDQKTGRDPDYWWKLGERGADKINTEEMKLASEWIEERQALIEKNIDRADFDDWLKELTQPATKA